MEGNQDTQNDHPLGQEEQKTEIPIQREGQELPEKRALSLIHFTNEEGFKVSDEAIEFLTSIKEKVGVIVVAGKYRTGKSFLLNRIILGKIGEGFGVGPTINPCTKGLWVWNEIVETEYNGEKLKVIIIDSEGIGAFDEDHNHDTKIFLFALLLSSYFIYNSMGTIDENAINNLSLIINLSKNLHIQAETTEEEDPDELAKYFPRFLWVLRDFSLKLRDEYDNPISSKEYFEHALMPQKGISEKVEARNRIRRLIKHFFTDRDCATLVRPTEEETDLQALQSLPDDILRPEFVDAAKKLRSKIFKKVKPKTLNGKFITGEMLLELCHSYTKAINKGTVPSIKNAWSYVCQNECQRAINDSIRSFEEKMNEFMHFCKQQLDQKVLDEGTCNILEEAVRTFKSKAVGGDTEEFEQILRKELKKKEKDFMKTFNSYCEEIMDKKYDRTLNQIRREINLCSSPGSDQDASIREQINIFRHQCQDKPYFDKKEEWILEKCLSLTLRFAENSALSEKKESETQVKIYKTRCEEYESVLAQLKHEKEIENASLKEKLQNFQEEKTDLLAKTQLYESRMDNYEKEKEKLEQSFRDKYDENDEEKSRIIDESKSKITQLVEHMKEKEEQYFMSNKKLENINALLEQKMEMIESSMKEIKEEKQQKEKECKELLQQAKTLKKENEKIHQEMKMKEQKNTDQVKKLTEKVATQSKAPAPIMNTQQIAQQNPHLQQEFEALSKERDELARQVEIQTIQLEERRNAHEELLSSFKSIEQSKLEALKTNSILSESVKRSDERAKELEEKLKGYKIYQKIFESSSKIQCVHCEDFISANAFKNHLTKCPSLQTDSSLPPLKVELTNSNIRCDEIDGYSYREYILNVDYRGKEYKIRPRINLFLRLYDSLDDHFPSLKFPEVPEIFALHPEDRQAYKEAGHYANDLSEDLQGLLLFFCKNPVVRESVFFKKFLEIDKQFPDEFANKWGVSGRKRGTIKVVQSYSNLELMPDGHPNNIFSSKEDGKVAYSMIRHADSLPQNQSPNGRDDIDTDDDECVIEEKNINEYIP
ncbi:unnamed protein product [Moneuplotes crassus]|uniref:GB1/RHD3-type G domain-containing protein n=1 Tax=Euplotes crassus TaxID=5936 RepID=A0AAD1XUF8_EUPCR|nr:unnamed protein product [Moneuplotes crassus]